ncbi:uncharacterized protein ZBAI_05000 [Zygosaccharomyces bailii ISA1307]|nr:uncharacterized protein ZBAI_05000 [Zygosaccharomyces bailii ISA1307]
MQAPSNFLFGPCQYRLAPFRGYYTQIFSSKAVALQLCFLYEILSEQHKSFQILMKHRIHELILSLILMKYQNEARYDKKQKQPAMKSCYFKNSPNVQILLRECGMFSKSICG